MMQTDVRTGVRTDVRTGVRTDVRTGVQTNVRTIVQAIVLVAAGASLGAQQQAAGLPEAAGVEIVRAKCVSCHEADMIVSQRLSRAGWTREIDKMVRWGARVTDEEREPLTSYLARFGPSPAVAHDGRPTGGEAVFKRACLSCHGADLAEGQRLSPTGWTREVEKMMRWGAQVSEQEKGDLVAYLAATYPLR